jgi:hypothetical protein
MIRSLEHNGWILFLRNIDTHIHMSTHPYKYTYTHPTPISISKRLSRLDLEIHEVGHQERLAIDGDVVSH